MRTWKYIILACITVGNVSHIHTMTQKEQIFDAVKRGNYHETEILLKTNPNLVYAREGDSQVTPLHYEDQKTPLHWAAGIGQIQIVRLLIDTYKADPNARDKDQLTPLHYTAMHDRTQLAQLLIDTYKANPNAEDAKKETPLHWAARNGRTQLAQLLIKYKANPNAKDRDQVTPLHIATLTGHTQIAQLLIKNNATIDARNNTQLTLLHIAALYGQAVTSWWLIALGANLKAQDMDGDTPPTIRNRALSPKEPKKTRILLDEILPKIMNSKNANYITEYAKQNNPLFPPHYPVMAALGQLRFAMARELMHRLKANKLITNEAVIDIFMLKGLTQRQNKAKSEQQPLSNNDLRKQYELQQIVNTIFPHDRKNANAVINTLENRNLALSLNKMIHKEISRTQQQANLWQQVTSQNHLCDIKFKIQG